MQVIFSGITYNYSKLPCRVDAHVVRRAGCTRYGVGRFNACYMGAGRIPGWIIWQQWWWDWGNFRKTISDRAATAGVTLLFFCAWAWNNSSFPAHRQKKKTIRFWKKE
jgi:hypothetical protein